MDPFGRAVGPVLFLPDGYEFLQAVDGVAARLECFAAMRATYGHGNADFADLQTAQSMNHGDVADRPALPRVGSISAIFSRPCLRRPRNPGPPSLVRPSDRARCPERRRRRRNGAGALVPSEIDSRLRHGLAESWEAPDRLGGDFSLPACGHCSNRANEWRGICSLKRRGRRHRNDAEIQGKRCSESSHV